MNESKPCPTPRTDELQSCWRTSVDAQTVDVFNLARSLERELIKERKDHFKNIETERELKSQKRQKIESLEVELIATQLALKEAGEALTLLKQQRHDCDFNPLESSWICNSCGAEYQGLIDKIQHIEPCKYAARNKALSNPLTQQALSTDDKQPRQ